MCDRSHLAEHRAAEKARVDAAVRKTMEIMERRTLDIIFAGKRAVTRTTAERRLSAKQGAAHV